MFDHRAELLDFDRQFVYGLFQHTQQTRLTCSGPPDLLLPDAIMQLDGQDEPATEMVYGALQMRLRSGQRVCSESH